MTAAVELAPGSTLVGLAKRSLPGVELVAVKTPDDLDQARTVIGSRPQHGQGEHTPEFQVAVSPVKGVFARSAEITEGDRLGPATVLGVVRTNRDEHPIATPGHNGPTQLVEWLRHDGDIVAAGLPVARLHRVET